MAQHKPLRLLFTLLLLACTLPIHAQITPGAYMATTQNVTHELKITDTYFIYTVYESQPANFIKTMGGFYTLENGVLHSDLEFNSNVDHDGSKKVDIPFEIENTLLVLQLDQDINFERQPNENQALDGLWLFATRGPDEGQERRGEENPRKTLKFLMDGRFQWVAYHTETFAFSGTGGGSYTAANGVYTEQIDYFSRDNDRVGATLTFAYDLQGGDWHHTGKNSRGEPLYEIWSKRN